MTDASLVWEGWLEFTRLVRCALKRAAKARTKVVKEVVKGFLSHGIHPSIPHEAAIHPSLATIHAFLVIHSANASHPSLVSDDSQAND